MTRPRFRASHGALLALCACTSGSEGPDASAETCFLGDPSKSAIIEPIFRQVDGSIAKLEEGSSVPLILPPQGGKVIFVGVRAQNLDGCPIEISASMRDPCSNALVALERRPIRLTPTASGWLEPLLPTEIVNYSNLPACPRAGLERDIEGQPYEITIRVEDKSGRKAEAKVSAVPFCAEPEFRDRCTCECRAAYRQGDTCEALPDSGVPAGTCALDGGTDAATDAGT
ncbi:MAG: hypothetical protein HY791_30670 [Deltaproteobacteria bacterium]|nr:hypothetical protein [Deltaproteobacteria bacterium]